MNSEIVEWLLLLGRWLHITVAIAWIGNSFFFMWLDRTLENGELWMVHGGGFYQVQKKQMGPTPVPKVLHWFKWESYWTWMSGIFLLTLIFYAGNGTFLLDNAVSAITFQQALLISISSIVASWLFYDTLWELKAVQKNTILGHSLTLLWFAGVAYFLCHTFSGRAAYIHIGAMLGTWMTANVFLRIIPRQIKMVEAAKKGEPINQDWGKNAKNRSTHNTYFTLPVIFIMLSNHFPSTYGNRYGWIILLIISAAGAAIREYFVARVKTPGRSKIFGMIGVALIIGAVLLSLENKSQPSVPTARPIPPPPTANSASTAFHGIVRFEGPQPKRQKLQLPAFCNRPGEIDNTDILIQNDRLQNVVVRITRGHENLTLPPVPETAVVLDQRDCLYDPRIVAVRVGQKVDIINSDSIFHNVRSISSKNENFNIAMLEKSPKITRVFDKPEIVLETKCSVHPWMSASIAVVDHPYFSVTDSEGRFAIPNLTSGKYTVEAWHEVFGTQTQEVTFNEKEGIEVLFTFKNTKGNL